MSTKKAATPDEVKKGIVENLKARRAAEKVLEKARADLKKLNREGDDLERILNDLQDKERRAELEKGREAPQDGEAPGAIVEGKSGSK
jgi:hypothetical protein